jgi:hypothetical protein
MDSENSGAIFRLKNIALVRSSPIVPATKGIESKVSSAKKKPVISDQSAAINSIFDQIYRATPLPSAILQNSNYNTSFWDNGLQFASDMPNISPIYGISQSLSASHSGGVNHPFYESSHQLHLHNIQSRQQNQNHPANFSAPTMIPPSNRQRRISDGSTSLPSQHQAGSQFQWQVELKDSPAENSAQNPILINDSRNNPEEKFSFIQDSEIADYADEPTIENTEVEEDYRPTSTGKEDATVTNTAVSNSSNFVSRTENINNNNNISISNSSSSSSSSRAQPSSSSTAISEALGDVSARPKLRRKFVMDSLFSLNIKPLAEQQIPSDNDSIAKKTPRGKVDKITSGSETTKLSAGASKGVTGKKLAATLEADNIDHSGSICNLSKDDDIAHVNPVPSGVGLSYMANLPISRNSASSNGKATLASSSKSKYPSKSPKTQRQRSLVHGSLVLVPLARLHSSSSASSSDDGDSDSYHKVRRRARGAVKASADRKKARVSHDKFMDLDLETEIGTKPPETLRADSDCEMPSKSLNCEALNTSFFEESVLQPSLPQESLLRETELQETAFQESIPQESAKTAVIIKVRESTRLRRSSAASDEDPPLRDDPPSPGPRSMSRSTRSSLGVGGRRSTESEGSPVGVRAGVRPERVLGPEGAQKVRTTRRKLVETLSEETVAASPDEWHKDEVRML